MTIESDQNSRLGLFHQRTDPGSFRVASVGQHASRSSRLRILVLAPLILFLVWEVVTRSFAAYLADTRPDIALGLRSTNPTALLNLAQDKLDLDPTAKNIESVVALLRDEARQETFVAKGIQSAQDLDLSAGTQLSTAESPLPPPDTNQQATAAQARSLAELALLNDPLNARAFRILGQLSQRTKDELHTERLMQAAVRRSLQESEPVYWMMLKSYRAGDYRSAIHYADVLLRTRPNLPQAAMPLLGKISENRGAVGELKQILAGNPAWRFKFFGLLPNYISDARAPLDILLSLKDTPKPPSAAERNPYLNLLIRHQFYELAYYTWLQFLPPEQLSKAGHLFNGSFEVAPSGAPFDWQFTGQSGVTIQIADRPDSQGERALFVSFGHGRVEAFSVKQIAMLPPGDYQFRGRQKFDIASARGLPWRITCANKAQALIGQSATVNGAGSTWEDFEFSFTVPSTDCPAQYVQLALDARSASEQFVSGSTWYDDLEIVRKPSL